MNVRVSALNFGLKSTEKSLNRTGYIPIVSSFSGVGRILLGVVQIISSVAYIIFRALKQAIWSRDEKFKIKRDFYYPLLYIGHGFANLIRGAIEVVPGPNLLLKNYDEKLRVCYPYESDV